MSIADPPSAARGPAAGRSVASRSSLAGLLGDLLDLVLPRRCAGCGCVGALLCRSCAAPDRVVVDLGRFDVTAFAPYGDALRRVLIRYKERGRHDLAGPLARLLAAATLDVLSGCDVQTISDVRGVGDLRNVRDRQGVGRAPPRSIVLVPVPSSRAAVSGRGGDHLLRLTRRAAAIAGVRVAPAVLRHTRTVRDSAGLGVDDRERNITGALSARAGPDGLRVVLVDDIVTTGATLREAYRALSAAGWPVLGAAVIAATPRRTQRSGRPRSGGQIVP